MVDIAHSQLRGLAMSNRRVVHTCIVVIIGLCALISCLFTATAQAQTGFPLVCRSGGGMQLSWSSLASARTHFIAYYSRARTQPVRVRHWDQGSAPG
jgi:hypothetical protein